MFKNISSSYGAAALVPDAPQNLEISARKGPFQNVDNSKNRIKKKVFLAYE